MAELIEPVPGGLERYRPQMPYLLIDEGAFEDSELAGLRNLAAALFRLENSRTPQDLDRVLESLIQWLEEPAQSELRRAFTVWLKRVLLPARLPGVEIPRMIELVEVKAMLAERVQEWTRQWKQEGLDEGRKEGLKKGRREGLKKGRKEGLKTGRKVGQAEFLLGQLERKFGPLPPEQRQRVLEAGEDDLWRWGERVLTAETLDEVFGR